MLVTLPHLTCGRGRCGVVLWDKNNKIMTAKEQANSLVEYFWTDIEEQVERFRTINMSRKMAKDCAIKVAEEVKAEISGFDRNYIFVSAREDFWDDVISEIRNI